MKKLLLSLSLIALSSTINAQWTSQFTGFADDSRGLNQIKIVDANTVWALAYDGSGAAANVQEFTRTTNGGASWSAGVVDLGNPDLEINNISAVSATTAWVSALVPADGNGVIFKTTDGGASWNQQLSTGFQTTGASFLNSVYFFNENVGIAYGDPTGSGLGEFEVYRTTDGGDNWTQISAAALPNPLSGEYGYNNTPIAVGNTLWFTTNKGNLLRTDDAGITWTKAQAPLTDFGSAAQSGTVIFSSETNGYLLKTVGTTYTFYTTSNGGTTWSAAAAFTGTRRLLTYIPGTTTIVATSAAVPVGTSVSTDNGTTWTDVESGAQRGVSSFLNATTGWCAGFSGALVDGVFKLTSPLATTTVTATAKFRIYPNPATSTVTISATDVDSYKLSVTDLTGKTVMTKSLNGMENNVDVSALSSGAYFFELSSENKREVVKILKN
ncbi:T9SS type A sorting domain-containing protein [Flavobacterium sp.]|uniref:T9SS type A sorting domain-containing protein n=1 Tax=Flavobacterium sp. TaxID=239 RepID=UPI002488C1B1|nr:T9SS type A sorting domain-containing protein [Flavobacterium sp.]MDI1317588.1 T9SS type A sorting domain-containing protein [Flavobacterium sp.]